MRSSEISEDDETAVREMHKASKKKPSFSFAATTVALFGLGGSIIIANGSGLRRVRARAGCSPLPTMSGRGQPGTPGRGRRSCRRWIAPRLAQYYNEPLESPWNGSRLSPYDAVGEPVLEDDWASSSEARLAELKLLLLLMSSWSRCTSEDDCKPPPPPPPPPPADPAPPPAPGPSP
uniref:Uncharacterized protein n=1 Tax=Anopheles atroparvus TaxID=41427 RepID=A0A182J4D8_ANOAO